MRRNFRKKENDKVIIYSIAGIVAIIILGFALLIYGQSLDKENQDSQFDIEQLVGTTENEKTLENNNTKSASSSLGKSVEEKEKEDDKTATKEETKKEEVKTEKTKKVETNTTSKAKTMQQKKQTQQTANSVPKKEEETKKELSFQMPVEGDIIHEFAKENLIFSETLQEWVTHSGIDIKAEKASMVQAAEDGIIKTIKNDPRYGLTIVIEHENGFETVYASLLSSEFVKEGEKVVKGQTIGTVGNTAAFESAEGPHLHFEILKESIQVNPSIYIK